jgi:DNA repair protein RecN (Recombination protein N)
MLAQLTIENLALVDRIEIAFGRGLNVLTGETGAGKSVLVNALSLVLGSRAQTDVIRSGEETAIVEALFELPEKAEIVERLLAKEIDVERGGELVIRRVLARSGKGKVTVNGQLVTLSMLAEVARGLVDITGQHEHVSLLDADGHLAIVDAYGELSALRERVARAHAEVSGYRAALEALVMDEAEKTRREDYLRFSLEEIEAAEPKVGEIEELEAEKKRLKHAAELADGIRRTEGSLYSDDGAIVEVVGRIQNELVRLSRMDDRLAPLSGSASTVLAELEDLAHQLSRYQGTLASDPERLSTVEERIELLKKLARKHGGSIEAVLAQRSKMDEELDSLEHEEARRADLGAALEDALERRKAGALELSAARAKVVRALEMAIQSELAELSLEKAKLKIQLSPLDEPGPRGAETAEILISPNPGEPTRPLRRIASGGELSRVLLAIKHVLAHRTAVSTYVFDEIDTGIGGAVADVLGRKLKEVARDHQIVCITHLAQVAAHAEQQFCVSKAEEGGRTLTSVRALSEKERVEELARMLGGKKVTDKSRGLAEEMLKGGRKSARVERRS